jgi:hypothetical protein
MPKPLPLGLLANGVIPGRTFGVPEGREAVYHWAGPVSFSLAVLVLGLWLVRVRNARTGAARALLWAGAGCLAVGASARGIETHQGSGVFYPAWALAFPVLVGIAVTWWILSRQLSRSDTIRPRLESLAAYLAVGFFGWWFYWVVSDTNWWALRGFGIWATVMMPWLWAGAFGAVVCAGWWKKRSPESRRIQSASMTGAGGGFLAWYGACMVRLVFTDRRDHEPSITGLTLFGIFVLGGAWIGARLGVRSIGTQRANDVPTGGDPLPDQRASPPSPAGSPANTSSG